jgi:AraC-like DNA-binding protein
MEDFNKIIESLGVRYIKGNNINILQPVEIESSYDVENTIVLLRKGEIKFGAKEDVLKSGEILFIPGGKTIDIAYGKDPVITLTNDDFINKKELYFRHYENEVSNDSNYDSFSYVTFEAKVFNSVNFFTSLDIPPFKIRSGEISSVIHHIVLENDSELPGSERIIKLLTEQLVVEIIRYIIVKNLFVEQLATNSTYFKDPRLIDIFAYIKENIGGDLSNKVLANVANVSEDYVGQYFKMLTGINPQDYIEYQRMEEAVNLLRTSKSSIRDIGRMVGYKDTAYFCRRFKMMFGIPAGKMRRRESLMNL